MKIPGVFSTGFPLPEPRIVQYQENMRMVFPGGIQNKDFFIQSSDNPHPEGLMYLPDTTAYVAEIPTRTCRFLGPSNSQKYRACQVPSARRPSITGTI